MRLLCVVLTCCVAACSTTSVTAPSAPSGHTALSPPTTPPTSPPSSIIPTLTGTWAGTAVVVTSFVTNSYNTCSVVLYVTSQASGPTGQFFGFLQFTGGTVTPCGQSGNAFGSVGANGSVSLSFTLTGDQTQCSTLVDTAPLTGLMVTDTMTLSQTVHRSCTSSTSAYTQDGIQSLSLSLRR